MVAFTLPQLPQLPQLSDLPKLPQLSELQSKFPNLSELPKPTMPEFSMPRQLSDLPKPTMPTLPQMPEFSMPRQLADLPKPTMPEFSMPRQLADLPKPTMPQMPQFSMPRQLADLPKPTMPEFSMPRQLADLPKPTMPALPQMPQFSMPRQLADLPKPTMPQLPVAAEYLAKGYQLSDQVLARAIELDQQRGISKKFLEYVNQLDRTVGERALGPEQTISSRVGATVGGAVQQVRSTAETQRSQVAEKGYMKRFQEYYTTALESPIAQRVRDFYTNTSKQIVDIHEEARRIASEEKAAKAAAAPQALPEDTPAPIAAN